MWVWNWLTVGEDHVLTNLTRRHRAVVLSNKDNSDDTNSICTCNTLLCRRTGVVGKRSVWKNDCYLKYVELPVFRKKPLAYNCHPLQLCYCIKNPPNMALIIYAIKLFIVYTDVLYISVL